MTDEPERTEDDTMLSADEPMTTGEERAAEGETHSPSAGDRGKKVVDASGREVGVVTDVDEMRGRIYVDPDPGLTDRLKAALHVGEEEDAYAVEGDRIREIESDRVVVDSL